MSIFSWMAAIGLVSFLYVSAYAEATSEAQSKASDPIAVVPPKGQVPENFLALDTANTETQAVFVADKANRTLTVWTLQNGIFELAGAYPMDIGKNQGDKTYEGDHRTPEGIYFFQDKLEGRGLDFNEYGRRAFTLDYPNVFDQRARKTGKGIWLHAVPDTKSLLRGSRGCVVVRNDIIEKLTPFILLKTTPILILDKVTYVPQTQVIAQRQALTKWLDSWRQSWETKNLDAYMSHYSDSFNAMKMNKSAWRSYKSALNDKYNSIRVGVGEPFFVARGDDAVIRFVQKYDSDVVKDTGEKMLYLKKVGDKFEIVTEVWRALDQGIIAQKKNAEDKVSSDN